MQNTVTEKLHSRRQAVEAEQAATLKDLHETGKESARKYNKAVAMIQSLDKKLSKNPYDEKIMASITKLEEMAAGLKATVEFCNSTVEAQTGAPPKETKLHDARDHKGLYTKKNSFGHMLRKTGLFLKRFTGGA